MIIHRVIRRTLVVFMMASAFLPVHSQLPFDVAAIPDSLRLNANAVKREEQITLDVVDADKQLYSVHSVYTVLNKAGGDYLTIVLSTSRNSSLEEAEVKLYDAAGKQTARYKKKDFTKFSDDDGLIEDGMNYGLHVANDVYPVTIEYNSTERLNGTLSFRPYNIIDAGLSVQQSTYTARIPPDVGLRYKNQQCTLTPIIDHDGDRTVYHWSVKNLPAPVAEPGGPISTYAGPMIFLAPNNFGFYNLHGDMSSWKSYGAWMHNLLNGLEVLSDERKAFFADMVRNKPNQRAAVAAVYDYLQKNFRYVSIQLGIGGLKPFPARFTDEKKYGDCKGLSFYMYSVLRSLGIKSYVALVNAGYNAQPADPQFPMQFFNHMILCVPQEGDSLWLECTSNQNDFGFLGDFTENRNALLITDSGGVLVATPRSRAVDNTQTAVSDIQLRGDGAGSATVTIRSTGNQKFEMTSFVAQKPSEQKSSLVNDLGFMQPDECTITHSLAPGVQDTKVVMDIEKIPQFRTGNKMFLAPRLYSFFGKRLPSGGARTQDFYFRFPFVDADTTVYHLPEGFSVEALPAAVSRTCAFGTYRSSFQYDAASNTVRAVAFLQLDNYRIPASRYPEVKTFFDDVVADQSQKIVIKQN